MAAIGKHDIDMGIIYRCFPILAKSKTESISLVEYWLSIGDSLC